VFFKTSNKFTSSPKQGESISGVHYSITVGAHDVIS